MTTTVLIVDDQRTDREVLAQCVAKAGHNAVFATTGEEALEAAKKIQPAAIFMDVVMPGSGGFAACRQLKNDPATSKIPVIIVSTKNSETDKFWGEKQGANDYVAKPYSQEAMAAVINKWVR